MIMCVRVSKDAQDADKTNIQLQPNSKKCTQSHTA